MAIRVVVVGMGPRGQDWVREVQTAPAYELVACVDIDAATLQQSSSKLSVPSSQCFTDLREALNQNNCDAVIVATSASGHVEPCEATPAGLRGWGPRVSSLVFCDLSQPARIDWLVREGASSRARPKR